MPWTVQLSDAAAVHALSESIRQGPMLNDQGVRSLGEALVDMIGGLKIEIFADEHPPPHFRVSFQGETANYRIRDCAQLNGGLNRFYRNVRAWHHIHKPVLIDEWNRRRPSGCPVGLYSES